LLARRALKDSLAGASLKGTLAFRTASEKPLTGVFLLVGAVVQGQEQKDATYESAIKERAAAQNTIQEIWKIGENRERIGLDRRQRMQ
jgi:hypothetical protein